MSLGLDWLTASWGLVNSVDDRPRVVRLGPFRPMAATQWTSMPGRTRSRVRERTVGCAAANLWSDRPLILAYIDMSRQFPIAVAERRLKLCVIAADESWELWLCECGRRLKLAGTVAMEEAIQSWRLGDDAVAALRQKVIDQVQRGETSVPELGPGSVAFACPSRCDWTPQ